MKSTRPVTPASNAWSAGYRAFGRASLAIAGALLGACPAREGIAPDGQHPASAAPAAGLASGSTGAPDAGASDTRPALDCDLRKQRVDATLKAASSCRVDADCTTFMPGCPFGCARAVQSSANLEIIQAEIAEYRASCNECVYRCRPLEQPPSCRAGFCSLE